MKKRIAGITHTVQMHSAPHLDSYELSVLSLSTSKHDYLMYGRLLTEYLHQISGYATTLA